MVQVNIDIVYLIVVVASILISMTLHEIMHGLVGYWLGDDTAKHQGRLSLNPIRHVDPFLTIILPLVLALAGLPIFGGAKPVQINPFNLKWGEWGMALVAVAGPLTNMLMLFRMLGTIVVFFTMEMRPLPSSRKPSVLDQRQNNLSIQLLQNLL